MAIIVGAVLGLIPGIVDILWLAQRVVYYRQNGFDGGSGSMLCVEWLLVFALSAAAGVLAVLLTSGMMEMKSDAERVAAAAGVSFFVSYIILELIRSFVQPFFIPSATTVSGSSLTGYESGLFGGLLSAFGMLVCCAPFEFMISVAIAAICGTLLAMVMRIPKPGYDGV